MTVLDFNKFTNTINGVQKSTEQTRNGINPATKQKLPDVPVSTKADLDEAVDAARAAFLKWREVPFEDRQQRLIAWADEISKHAKEFISLLTREQGKPTHLAIREVQSAEDAIRSLAKEQLPEDVLEEDDEKKVIVRYTPLGVAVGIVPWNFPVVLAINKIVPAVLSGNAIIVKPSPFTPYCDLKIVELAQNFFPPGVIQCLSGDDNLGPWMTSHKGVDKVSFTGSTATGKKVMESCAKTLKRVTLELGGNDPTIVFEDVDIAKVAPAIAQLSFLNSGQICLAIKRIFVHSSIFDKFSAAMVEATKRLKVGEGNQEGVFLGPIQNSMQYERVKTFFDDIEKENQNALVGGKFTESEGYFVQPTIISNPKDSSRIVSEEPFGPIVPLLSFDTEEEAIKRANDTAMGLGASVWTNDLDRAERVAKKIEAGSVWVNEHLGLRSDAPFGGFRESGIGVEGGKYGLQAYCNIQTLFLKKTKL